MRNRRTNGEQAASCDAWTVSQTSIGWILAPTMSRRSSTCRRTSGRSKSQAPKSQKAGLSVCARPQRKGGGRTNPKVQSTRSGEWTPRAASQHNRTCTSAWMSMRMTRTSSCQCSCRGPCQCSHMPHLSRRCGGCSASASLIASCLGSVPLLRSSDPSSCPVALQRERAPQTERAPPPADCTSICASAQDPVTLWTGSTHSVCRCPAFCALSRGGGCAMPERCRCRRRCGGRCAPC